MGKKSRKKVAEKAARKEKLTARREQQLSQQDSEGDGGGDYATEFSNPHQREYFEGDRVWFIESRYFDAAANPNTYRGIVREILSNGELRIVSLQSIFDGDENAVFEIRKEKVFPDFQDFTLQFDIGDSVVYWYDKWKTGVVTRLWPVNENRAVPNDASSDFMVPHYMLRKDDWRDSGMRDPFVIVVGDDDSAIRVRPSSFRFKVGDTVDINPKKAEASNSRSSAKLATSTTLRGRITAVDVSQIRANYAVYECSFGKDLSCRILDDTDENISRADAASRDRLFDAIEQNCSFGHLTFLCNHFDIDVSIFSDLIVAKAIEFASLQALSWLQHKCNIDVLSMKDESGNTLLHLIAKSAHANRFIREAGSISCNKDKKTLLNFQKYDIHSVLNNEGDVWIQILIKRGDVKALEAALSPHHGFAWELCCGNALQELIESICISCNESGDSMMQCILDEFLSFSTLYKQFKTLRYSKYFKEGDFGGKDEHQAARVLMRFCRDWCKHPSGEVVDFTSCATKYVLNGCFWSFQLFYGADYKAFRHRSYRVESKEDNGEFIQRELFKPNEEDKKEYAEVDIFSACIIGYNDLSKIQDRSRYDCYMRHIKEHATTCDRNSCPSLNHHLQKYRDNHIKKYSDEKEQSIFLRRIALLEDDDNVEGRQKILDYLLCKEPNVELDVVQAIKHRQCWALRFMIDNGLLQMDALAIRSHNLIKAAKDLLFLDNGRLGDITVTCCLCFAAAQYDDLQSLEYLCESYGTPVEVIGGWNLLHFSAYMGRIEIIAWLSSQPIWDSLVAQVCVHRDFCNAFAVHIAASRGHLVACELMIELKVPLEDCSGRFPEDYANSSPHQYVLDWVKKRETPQTLKSDVTKLLELARDHNSSGDEIMDFIKHSTCLDIDTWSFCDCDSFDVVGPMGHSFGDMLHECLSNVDVEVMRWICLRLYFCKHHSYSTFWVSSEQKQRDFDARLREHFDESLKEGEISAELHAYCTKDLPIAQEQEPKMKEKLTQNDLVDFLRAQGHDYLSNLLRKKCFKKVSCVEPLTIGILTSAFDKGERLEFARAAILRVHVFLEMAEACYYEFRPFLARGGCVNEVEDFLSIQSAVTNALIHEGYDTSTPIIWYPQHYRSSLFDPIDMNLVVWSVEYDSDHPLRKQLFYLHASYSKLEQLHIVLATEGYAELMEFCLSRLDGWTESMELDVVRISSYFGHSAVTEMFLGDGRPNTLLSSADDRHREAILGAGEALRYRDLEVLVEKFGAPSDPIGDIENDNEDLTSMNLSEFSQESSDSLILSVLNGYVRGTSNCDADNKTMLKTLSFIVDRLGYSHDDILLAMVLITGVLARVVHVESLLDICQNVMKVMGLQPIQHHARMRLLCKAVVKQIALLLMCSREEDCSSVLTWLAKMAELGIDVQNLLEGSRLDPSGFNALAWVLENIQFFSELRDLEERQQKRWSNFAIVKRGAPLKHIQEAIDGGDLGVGSRDRGGLLLTHLSAAYDRVDLLEWLVDMKGMQLDSTDGENRTALEVAEASKALQATKWITERKARDTITSFMRRNYYRAIQIRRLKRSIHAATTIQRYVRGYSSRKLCSGALSHRLEESKRFQTIWGHLAGSMAQFSSSWSSIRENLLDIQMAFEDELLDETDRRLKEAVDVAVEGDMEDGECNIEDEAAANLEMLAIDDEDSSAKETDASSNEWLSFQMTSHVVKFLQQGDKKYKSFFVRRMQQLARGERSRILKKPLKGSQSHIFETYLEQKSGHRILWTEERGIIVVWYVAKHKQVSRLMQLIDDSKSRSARQLMPQPLSEELRNEDVATSDEPKREVLLDIVGNVPMKIYDVSFNTITDMAKDSWTPQLHLTDEERDIVEAVGTVLVLGRSGTGKTVCICNRIECDRQSRAGRDPSFTQLFVARSVKLCKYVEGAVGEDNRTSFCTYSRLLSDIETSLPGQHDSRSFNPSQKMDFHRFKQEFSPNSTSNMKVSALILWTVIRTFLKGSIEAFQSPSGILPRDDFLEVEKLGKNRCRIPLELREHIYDEFLRYESYIKERKLWDDCDRVRHLLHRIKESQRADPDAFSQVQKSKVYVDEVQDYTQLEILLFFYLSGPNGLFLAGDPAQSVVEGTEFRFEEVRSVGHFVGSVMQKPNTVNINFRSHSGILNCAGGVLDFLFSHFPSSAKQLKKDEGLFQGSRPGILLGTSVDQLNILLSDKLKGAVVLTHDESAPHWRRLLNDYKLVYGIREAKGLEFKTVIILDFFRDIPSSLQKPWRELVLGRADQDFEYQHPVVGNMLKLLYTGVTRCIEKLLFVETSSSTAGKGTIRWLTKQFPGSKGCFATLNVIDDVEAMSMTADEFVGEGINNAELSESAEDLDEAERYLERAVWCFEQAENADLVVKARMHHSSVLFRRELQSSLDERGKQNHAIIEMKAANMMGSLWREGLFSEVLNTFYAVRPYLSAYAVEQLERGLVPEVRRVEAQR